MKIFLLPIIFTSLFLSADKENEILSQTIINSTAYQEDKVSYCRNRSNPEALDWLQEFSGSSLSKDDWRYRVSNGFKENGQYIPGWGNGELQYYTRPDRKNKQHTSNNLFIEDGLLKIQATHNSKSYLGFNFTSARIDTRYLKSFTYPSRITICFKVPRGGGFWPAFWLMPLEDIKWPQGGEIDIMEHRGRISNIASSALHFGEAFDNKSTLVGETLIPKKVRFVDKFHSISLEWRENELKFFLDNEKEPYFSVKNTDDYFSKFSYPFNRNYYMILNVAAGGIYDDYWVDKGAFCIDKECSNMKNPDNQRFLVDWIEYEILDN
jgi:beta-glucanase (GH16 family)